MQSTEEKEGRVGESKHIKSRIGHIASQWLEELASDKGAIIFSMNKRVIISKLLLDSGS